MARVASELEMLGAPGEPLSMRGPRATTSLYLDAERVHRSVRLAREYLDLQPDVAREGRAAIVTAGPPGAGKSTTLGSSGLGGGSWREVDADKIKELIIRDELLAGTYSDLLERELSDGKPLMPLELSTLVHRESVAIASQVAAVSLRRGENIVIQGTLGWEGQTTAILKQLRGASYGELTIVDVEASLEVAIKRALDRWWSGRYDDGSALGGRFVPTSVIESLYLNGSSKCRANATMMFELADFPSSQLITVENVDGEVVMTTRQKYDGEEFVLGSQESSVLFRSIKRE